MYSYQFNVYSPPNPYTQNVEEDMVKNKTNEQPTWRNQIDLEFGFMIHGKSPMEV